MNTNHRKALLKQVRVRSHHQAMLSELAMRSLNGFDTRRASNDWDNRSTFDDGRRLTGETLGNGVTETRTYSTDNLLTGISYGGTGTSIGNLSYTWDANKNKTSEGFGGTMSGYGFTAAGTSYDDEDRLTGYARTSGTFTQSWNLTKVGDWTSVTTNGTAQNRTHGPTHELLTAGGQNISTDVKGNITLLPLNLTPQSSPLALQWDFDNKLRSADLGNNSSVDVNFQYDALGRRVARTGTGGSVVYVQHDQQTIADYPVGGVASTPTNRYVYASYIDEPVVRKAAGTGGTIHYYHRNQQYSITAMTTSTGAVAERYAYTAYGQPTILNASGSVLTSSAIGNRYTYTGREWDETLGLHHFRARWMSPLAGRFLGRDPIGYLGSPYHLYESLDTQVLVKLDPSGKHGLHEPIILLPMPWDRTTPMPATPPLGPGSNVNRPLGVGYFLCGGCTKFQDRLRPIPGVSNPQTRPINGTGPGTGKYEIYPFPTNPPTAVGTGGAGPCLALIVKCPGFVAVFHFGVGNSPIGTLNRFNWPQGCDAIVCGGNPREPQSDCLADDVISAAQSKFNLVGVSGNSGCGVDENGNWYQIGN